MIFLACELHLSPESEVAENSSILRFLVIWFSLVIGQTLRQATQQHVSHFLWPGHPTLLMYAEETIEHGQQYSLKGAYNIQTLQTT